MFQNQCFLFSGLGGHSRWLTAVVPVWQNTADSVWWSPFWHHVHHLRRGVSYRPNPVHSIHGWVVQHHCLVRPWLSFLCGGWHAGVRQRPGQRYSKPNIGFRVSLVPAIMAEDGSRRLAQSRISTTGCRWTD